MRCAVMLADTQQRLMEVLLTIVMSTRCDTISLFSPSWQIQNFVLPRNLEGYDCCYSVLRISTMRLNGRKKS